ncbi:coil containing protein [Vibrio phage 1.211.B._10N.222.52.F11]|nr:coil containing protein [Vibrio phage 1.211.A._10N.222.52.F11]AUR95763.1 coil containing protein [Vibrio phage 1.211.B._10N.222.52.F11]
MKIENKGALVEAFAAKKAEVQRLNNQLGQAESDLEKLHDAIVVDESLLGKIQEGGIHTIQNDLVVWAEEFEELIILKAIHSWDEKTELNSDQVNLIGGLNE